MTTKEKVIACLEYYKASEEIETTGEITELLNSEFELSYALQSMGDNLIDGIKVPEIYWNEGSNNGSDYYTFVTMYSNAIGKSIILDWDSNVHRMTNEEILEEVVKVWEEAEALENKLSTLK